MAFEKVELLAQSNYNQTTHMHSNALIRLFKSLIAAGEVRLNNLDNEWIIYYWGHYQEHKFTFL